MWEDECIGRWGDGEDGSWGGRKMGGVGRWIVRNWDGEGGS